MVRRTRRIYHPNKKFNSEKVVIREKQITQLFIDLSKLCDGKEIAVVADALQKLQDLTY
jgi:hypothetical protein